MSLFKGTTLFQFIPKIKSGLIFLESFESNAFMTDQVWATLNGAPTNSPLNPKDGVRSFPVDSSFPLISKNVTTTPPVGWLVGYLFDDATNITGKSSYFIGSEFSPSLANSIGLGVDNGVSTTNYVLEINGAKVASNIVRTSGYHRITIKPGQGLPPDVVTIDGANVLRSGGGPLGSSNTVKFLIVGSLDTTGASPFNFMDFFQVALTNLVSIFGLQDGQKVYLYSADNTTTSGQRKTHNLIGSGVSSGNEADIDVSTMDNPFNAFFMITDAQAKNVIYVSPVIQMSAGDEFYFTQLDFGRRATSLDVKETAVRTDKESNSGVNESVFFNSRNMWTLMMNDITDDQRLDVLRWWAFAQQANAYSVAVDSQQAAFFYITDPSASQPTVTGSVVIETPAGIFPNIRKGADLILRARSSMAFEEVTVASVQNDFPVAGVTTLTFTAPPVFGYGPFDQVVSPMFTPFAISVDKILNLALSNARVKRWNFNHKFKEGLF